jgi:hypothetical protein
VSNNSDNWWAFGFHTYLLADDHFNPRTFEAKLPAFVKKYLPVPAGNPPPPSLHVQPLLDVHLASEYSSQISPPGDRGNIYLSDPGHRPGCWQDPGPPPDHRQLPVGAVE